MTVTGTPAPTSAPCPPRETARAARILARCREIAKHTETAGQITRTFLSPPMHGVHRLLCGWMEAAGMSTSVDAAGNLRGVYAASHEPARRIILGSHLDSVPNAGAFDGVLGVVMAVAVVEALGNSLPVSIEVIGFSEEEGIRFRRPFLGSLAVIGRLNAADLALTDADGITVADAIRNFGLDPVRISEAKLSANAAAYLELHIEQGPVLEHAEEIARRVGDGSCENFPRGLAAEQRRAASTLGIVETIVGQSRLLLTFQGQANHAGTTPMPLRRDALAAAAEWVVAVETMGRHVPDLVATVGRLEAEPGASNVIPGLVRATLDVRHPDDAKRAKAVVDLIANAEAAARARQVLLTHETLLEQSAVRMNADLVLLLQKAVTSAGHVPHVMPSGAGHDAMILAPQLPAVMLFLPSPGGLSHHPEEAVLAEDIEAALQTVLEFLRMLSHDKALSHA